MNLENTFYVMAIIFMTLMFLGMIALVVMVFYIKGKITEIQREVEKKIHYMTEHTGEFAADTAAAVASKAVENLKKKILK